MKKILIAAAAVMTVFTACTAAGGDIQTETPAALSAEQPTDPAKEIEVTTTTSETTTTTSETTTTTTETTTEFTQREIPFEDTAQNAYDRLMASFETAEGVIFPDDYAGTYSYFGTIYICFTDSEGDIPENYNELFADYTCVKFKTVNFSLNDLTRISDEAAALLKEKYDVSGNYVDIPSNMAVVSISSGDTKAAQLYLKGLPDLPFDLDQLTIILEEKEEN